MIWLRVAMWLCVAGTLFGQDKDELPPPADVAKNLETLRELAPALRNAEAELESLRVAQAAATTEDAKEEASERIDAQRARVSQLRENFRIIASGVEDSAYRGGAERAAELNTEFKELLAPLLESVREVTAQPRQMEELRSQRKVWTERLALAQAALARIESTLAATNDGPVRAELEAARKLWSSRRDEARSETETLNRQISEREKTTPTAWEAISGMLTDFWRSRGLNVLLAFGCAVAVFFGMRRIYRYAKKISPLHRKKGGGLVARSADLIAAAASGLLAFLAVVLVFYLRGDWLMLTLAIVFLLGLLWASKAALPPYLDQIKVILNLGPVRQGERLVVDGIPWRVDALNMYCDFSNPELTGGTLRLPVKELLSLRSRPSDPKESWFPTRENDWVTLADGCYGKVIQQTPEHVVVLRLGGSLKTYPTADFLEQRPENLSRGFRVGVTFGIGYGHRSEATGEIPEALEAAVHRHLVEALGHDQVRSVKVEFKEAAASSLDFQVLADFSGDAAARYAALARWIQEACVNACNREGWEIPFPQMVVHRA
jgi:small-conductance mechanosensitive channel